MKYLPAPILLPSLISPSSLLAKLTILSSSLITFQTSFSQRMPQYLATLFPYFFLSKWTDKRGAFSWSFFCLDAPNAQHTPEWKVLRSLPCTPIRYTELNRASHATSQSVSSLAGDSHYSACLTELLWEPNGMNMWGSTPKAKKHCVGTESYCSFSREAIFFLLCSTQTNQLRYQSS